MSTIKKSLIAKISVLGLLVVAFTFGSGSLANAEETTANNEPQTTITSEDTSAKETVTLEQQSVVTQPNTSKEAPVVVETPTSGNEKQNIDATIGEEQNSADSPAVEQPAEPATDSKDAEKPVTPEKDTTPINLGNSGMSFNSQSEAEDYGTGEIRNESSKWYGYGYTTIDLVNKDYETLGKWTVNFYERTE